MLVVCFAIIGLGALHGDYAASWVRLGVAPMYVLPGRPHSGPVPFGDTHNLLAAVDCARSSFDVKREDSCDVHGRPPVYSRAYLAGEVVNRALLAYGLHMLLLTRPSWLGWASGLGRAGLVRS